MVKGKMNNKNHANDMNVIGKKRKKLQKGKIVTENCNA
jgi:hypothetical protein